MRDVGVRDVGVRDVGVHCQRASSTKRLCSGGGIWAVGLGHVRRPHA